MDDYFEISRRLGRGDVYTMDEPSGTHLGEPHVAIAQVERLPACPTSLLLFTAKTVTSMDATLRMPTF